MRLEVARRARSTAADIRAEPVVEGLTALRDRNTVQRANAIAPVSTSRPDGLEDLLRRLRPFADLTPDESRSLIALCERVEAARGTVLWTAGSRPEFLYIVLRGALRASIDRGSCLEQLSVHGPGDLVGTLALMDGGPTHTQLDVCEDLLALRMERRNFESLRKGYSELGQKLFDQINVQLVRDLRRLMRHLGRLRGIRLFNERQGARHV